MSKDESTKMKKPESASALSEKSQGSATPSEGSSAPHAGPLAPGQRWNVARKREVVLRLLRGEPLDAVSRQYGVEIARLERWRDRALEAMEAGLRERGGDPLEDELAATKARLGELLMENELLRIKAGRSGPFVGRRSKR